jgi:hypothetical protein
MHVNNIVGAEVFGHALLVGEIAHGWRVSLPALLEGAIQFITRYWSNF